MGSVTISTESTQTISNSLKEVRDPTPTPPLKGRGKATGRRTQFGRSTSGRLLPTGRKNADDLLGDAHDAAHGLIAHAHFVEDEEEGVTSPFL